MHLIHRTTLAVFFISIAIGCLHAAEEPVDVEEFEPAPEGYEEKRYNIYTLISRPTSFVGDEGSSWQGDIVSPLSGQEVIDMSATAWLPRPGRAAARHASSSRTMTSSCCRRRRRIRRSPRCCAGLSWESPRSSAAQSSPCR